MRGEQRYVAGGEVTSVRSGTARIAALSIISLYSSIGFAGAQEHLRHAVERTAVENRNSQVKKEYGRANTVKRNAHIRLCATLIFFETAHRTSVSSSPAPSLGGQSHVAEHEVGHGGVLREKGAGRRG